MGTEVGEGEGLGMEWGCSNSFFSFDRIRCAVSAVKCIHKLMQCDASTCHSLHTYMHTSTTGYPIMGVRNEEIKAMPNTMVYKYMHCRTSTCTCTCNTPDPILFTPNPILLTLFPNTCLPQTHYCLPQTHYC